MFFTAAKPVKYWYLFFAFAAAVCFFVSCTVKDYPHNKPFVYQTNIDIDGKYSTEEKKQLISQLNQQLHDSIRTRWQQKFIFFKVLKNPARYDSLNAGKSELFMHAWLNRLGYYRDSIRYDAEIDTVDDQYRTTVNFHVIPGTLVRFDSIWYNLLDSVPYSPGIDTLQQITIQNKKQALIKKGDPFSKDSVSSELDRLTTLYNNNGFLLFNKTDLLGVWDTVGLALLRPTLDPIEQAQQLEALNRRRENPTVDLEIRLRPNVDTTHFTRYYVGDVRIYPDLNSDTSFYHPTIQNFPKYNYSVISYQNLFKPRKLLRYIYLHHGDIYSYANYSNTTARFSSLGAWRSVVPNAIPRAGQDTVDFEFRMTPAKKFDATLSAEVSRNQGNFLTETNLFGTALTLGLTNRNFAKAADLATTNLRYGLELSSRLDSIQTQQYSISHTILFPRKVPRQWPFKFIKSDSTKTSLTLGAGYTDRKNYFTIKSINTAWGYDVRWRNKLFSIRLPNIEYNFLQRGPLLDTLIKANQSYKYIFNDGLIISTILNYTSIKIKNKMTNVLRAGFEASGLVSEFINSKFFNHNLYPFLKFDAEFSKTYRFRRSAVAWRAIGGIGYELSISQNQNDLYLPFFREYYAGGPNSMRGWALRRLGPGSTIKSFSSDVAPDRFGDMHLETNFEYRPYLTVIFGFPVEGALFIDAGNIWFVRPNPDFPDGDFKLSRLGKDIAIDVGTGARIDFGFLKLRLDYAYKMKDPSPDNIAAQNKLFYNWKINNGQFQLGIDYPF